MRGIEQFLQVDAATLGALKYAGTWNASTNTPTLASGVGVQGQYYVVSVAGSTNLDGETAWQVGDWAVFNGTVWQKVDGGSTGLLSTLTVTGNTFLATTSGNVGIGTSSPAVKLDVVTASITDGVVANIQNSTTGSIFQFAQPGVANWRIGQPAGVDAFAFYGFAGGTYPERMRIDSAGNVGIGTGSPAGFGNTGKLAVQTASSTNGIVATFANSGATGAAIQFFQVGVDVATIGMPASSGGITFAPSGTTERMRITSAGDVGIGTSSPAYKLDVSGVVNSTAGYRASNGTTTGWNFVSASGGWFSGINTANAQNIGTQTNHPIVFATNNIGVATLDTAGNLGLGVTPSAWATYKATQVGWSAFAGYAAADTAVFSNAFFDGGYKYIGNGFASQYRQINSAHQWFTAPSGTAGTAISFTQAMTLDASGNLGVGTTSPTVRLQTVSARSATLSSAIFGTSGTGAVNDFNKLTLQVQNTLGGSTGGAAIGAVLEASASNQTALAFYNDGGSGSQTERARIDSAGNLGLGVTPAAHNPSGFGGPMLQVGNRASLMGSSVYSTLGNNVYYDSGFFRYIATDEASMLEQENGAFKWFTAPSGTAGNAISFNQPMTLDASGNLGVGTTSPSSFGIIVAKKDQTADTAISVSNAGAANAATSMSFTLNEAGTPQGWLRRYRDGSGNTEVGFSDALLFTGSVTGTKAERARIDASGNLLVGKTTASGTTVGPELLANGQINTATANLDNLNIYNTTAAAYRFYVNAAGTVFATNTTISAISDQRLKENVQDLNAGLDKIMALKPRKFDWKAGKGKNIKGDRGFIAQEFEQVFPDLIDEWKDPASEGEEPYKSVRQDLIPVLVKAIQELKAEVDSLKTQLGA